MKTEEYRGRKKRGGRYQKRCRERDWGKMGVKIEGKRGGDAGGKKRQVESSINNLSFRNISYRRLLLVDH